VPVLLFRLFATLLVLPLAFFIASFVCLALVAL
jgi:hypothetical protein